MGEAGARRTSSAEASAAFRKYYMEIDIFLSAEGILKVISIIGCLVCSVVFLSGGGACGGAPGLVASAGSVALLAGAALALLYAAVALQAPLSAPQAWLYTDLIVSSLAGVLLLLTGALTLALCTGAARYFTAPLAMATAGVVTAGAVVTYTRAMRQRDAAAPPRSSPRPPPLEHDV